MKMKTAVIRQGSVGNLAHNRREILGEEHINYEIENEVFVRETIQEAYHNAFGKAVKEFNSEQKRKDRRIDDYYKKLFKCDYSSVVQEATKRGKNKHAQKSFYENIIQIGNQYDSGVNTEDSALVTECLRLWFNGCPELNIPSYQERNPNIYVFEASIHLDEATAHIQLDYIPLAFDNEKGQGKFGLSVQNSHSRALEEMGFGNDEKSIIKWREHEVEKYLVPIMQSRGIQWIPPDKDNKRRYMNKPEYHRFINRIEEEVEIEREHLIAKLEESHAEKENELNGKISELQVKLQDYEGLSVSVDEVGDIGSKQFMSKNISVPPEQYELLQEQAKAYRANKSEIINIHQSRAEIEEEQKRLKELEEQLQAKSDNDYKESMELYRKAHEQWSMSKSPELFQTRYNDLKAHSENIGRAENIIRRIRK